MPSFFGNGLFAAVFIKGEENELKKALIYGILASFFLCVYLYPEQKHESGRRILDVGGQPQVSVYISHIVDYAGREPLGGQGVERVKEAPVSWLVWSTVGFGLFYAPLTFGSVLGVILAGSGYLAADHSGWRAFDAVIWKRIPSGTWGGLFSYWQAYL